MLIHQSALGPPPPTTYHIDSLVNDILKDEYKKQGLDEHIHEDQGLMYKHRVKTMRQWIELSIARKALFPAVLADILNMIAHKISNGHDFTPPSQTNQLAEPFHHINLEKPPTVILQQIVEHLFPSEEQLQEQLNRLSLKFSAPLFAQFVGREQFKKDVVQFAQSGLDVFRKNKTIEVEKQQGVVGCLVGASGIGKTRASKEIINILGECDILSEEVECFVVQWDFRNGGSLRPYENTNSSAIFGYRIFMMALGRRDHFHQRDMEALLSRNVFHIDTVMEVLSKYLNAAVKESRKTPMLIVIADEYQVPYEANPNSWKEPLYSLMGYMIEPNDPNIRLQRDNVCILPFVVGTLPEQLLQFNVTEYQVRTFDLPVLGLKSIETLVIDELTARGIPVEMIQRVTESRTWQLFWYEAGLVPRMLQYSVEVVHELLKRDMTSGCVTSDEDLAARFQWQLRNRLNTNLYYPFRMNDPIDHLLEFILSGTPLVLVPEMPATDMAVDYWNQSHRAIVKWGWFHDQRLRGTIYQTRSGRVYISRHHFRILVEQCKPSLLSYLPTLERCFDGADFERIDLESMVARLNLYIREGRRGLSLRWLFPGAIISDELEDIVINLPSRLMSLEKDPRQFVTKGNRVGRDIISNSDDEEMIHVKQCFTNTKLMDARWVSTGTVGRSTAVKVMIVIQYKFTGGSVRSDLKPETWASEVFRVLSQHFPGYKIIPVYITNSHVSEHHAPKQDKVPMVLVSRGCAVDYFSPNMYPFYLFANEIPDRNN